VKTTSMFSWEKIEKQFIVIKIRVSKTSIKHS